jgi:diguanylate cyclase (GGDEF)-like protein
MVENNMQLLTLIEKHHDISCIILDLTVNVDFVKTIKILKSNFVTYHIPIIVLINQISMDLDVDDFLIKPFEITELKARLIMTIRRTRLNQSINPLTKLPGNLVINQKILDRLTGPLAVIYADLDYFKYYNDKYGFNKGDLLIQKTAGLLTRCIKTHGNKSDFLGHIGGDDFIIISTPDKAEILAENICQEFDKTIPREFYNQDDLKSKKIVTQNRQGAWQEFPLITISLAIATNEKRKLDSLPLISQITAELKNYAKTKPGGLSNSNYVKDRRRA